MNKMETNTERISKIKPFVDTHDWERMEKV